MAATDSASGGVTSLFTKQAGPLPVWVWGALVGGGLYFAYRTNKGNAAAATVEPNVATGDGTYQAVGAGASTAGGSSLPGSADATITTNNAWGMRGNNYAVNTLGFNASDVDNAIRKYLAAQSLTASERVIITAILAKYGQPPEGLPPGPGDTSTPTPATTGPPPAVVNFRATSYGSDHINLSWSPAPGATRYRVQYSSDATGHMLKLSGETTKTVYSMHVNSKGDHYIKLTPVNSKGSGPSVSIHFSNKTGR